MGDSPPLLVTEAAYARLVEFDGAKALRLLETAEAMNPNSSEVCLYLARTLSGAGRVEEAFAHYQRAAELDPGNPTIAGDWGADLKMTRRVEEALRRSRDFEARYPGLITYGWRLFGFTAQLERAQRDAARLEAVGDPEAQLAVQFELLRFSQRFGELGPLVEQSGFTTIPQASFGWIYHSGLRSQAGRGAAWLGEAAGEGCGGGRARRSDACWNSRGASR